MRDLASRNALRIAITGAGAMGGLFGARLALAGYETVLIDVDPARLAAISAHGLSLEDDAGSHRVSVTAGLAEDFAEPVDLLIVFTKSMNTGDAIRAAQHILQAHSWVLTLQNGIGNERTVAAVVGKERVAFGVTTWPADLIAPGRVRSHGAGIVRLWSMTGGITPQIEKIAAVLNDAAFACVLDKDVRSAIWKRSFSMRR